MVFCETRFKLSEIASTAIDDIKKLNPSIRDDNTRSAQWSLISEASQYLDDTPTDKYAWDRLKKERWSDDRLLKLISQLAVWMDQYSGELTPGMKDCRLHPFGKDSQRIRDFQHNAFL